MNQILIAVVAEAPRDARVVKRLFERAGGHVEARLVGPSMGDPPFIKWADVPKLLLQHRVKARQGHFNGVPGKADSAAAANVLLLIRNWRKVGGQLDAVVLQRDIDKQPERREGLTQGRDAVPLDVPVVVGVADPKIEAWAICAFESADAEGQERLKALRTELGFDPREESHLLGASETGAKRNAKRVLEALLGAGDEAFRPLCEAAPLDTLRLRGSRNGLAEFLSDAGAVIPEIVVES